MNQKLPTHFGEVSISPIGPKDRRIRNNLIEYKLTYINNLPVPVTIGWRSGLKFTLPSEHSMFCDKLLMRVEVIVKHSVKSDIQRLLSAIGSDASPELKAMRESFSFEINQNCYDGVSLVLDYPLTLTQLREYGGTVYYNELDAVVSLLSIDEISPHPYSDEGRHLQLIDASYVGKDELGFGYSIELIDNLGKYGERYLNIGNKVYKVSPIKDAARRDGIYVVSDNPVTGERELTDTTVKHYSFEGADEKLGLYRTIEEALNLGDLSLARKHEINSLEHSLIMQKAELQNVKQQYEIETLERDKEMKLFEMERARHAAEVAALREKAETTAVLERQRVKDYYEDKSFVRKDSSETLKFLPSLVVGLGAILTAVFAFL